MIAVKTDVAYLTKKEVCDKLGVSRSTLDRMVARGSIPCVWFKTFTGNSYRAVFDPDKLDKWLAKRSREATHN